MIRTLRTVGLIEALSFLLLTGVAMPLKYWANQPQWVTVLGAAHGALWVVYIGLIGIAFLKRELPFGLAALLSFGSVLPFGPLLFERKLRGSQDAH